MKFRVNTEDGFLLCTIWAGLLDARTLVLHVELKLDNTVISVLLMSLLFLKVPTDAVILVMPGIGMQNRAFC